MTPVEIVDPKTVRPLTPEQEALREKLLREERR
jgi:hypothetical protein